MAAQPYTIISYEHPTGFSVLPLQLDTVDTALALPGKDYSGWGMSYSQNFVDLLENFSRGEPGIKSTGMLWYDVTSGLKVWNGTAWVLQGGSAARLTTPRNISLSGAATGSVPFDGSADVTIPVSLASQSGVTPGQYNTPSIVVDQQGLITSISNSGGDGAGPSQYVETFNTRSGNVTLTSQDVVNALGYTPGNGGSTLSAGAIDTALGYTPANDALVVHKSGDTMSGALNMNGSAITNLPNAINQQDPATLAQLQYVSAGRTQRVFGGTSETSYNVTVSQNAPSGGSDGDMWYRY
jgi:hypothetical protein